MASPTAPPGPPKMGLCRALAQRQSCLVSGHNEVHPIDAEAVARVALRDPDLPKARLDGPARCAKLGVDHRRLLVRQRTAAANKLRWFLHEIAPELPYPREAFASCASSRRWK